MEIAVADIYRFQVNGHLGDRWSDCFGGLAIQSQADGTTVLIGPVIDQVALHGLISQIRDLGLSLLSVNLVVNASPMPDDEFRRVRNDDRKS